MDELIDPTSAAVGQAADGVRSIASGAMRVLFVGADNVCVSPLAAALLYQQEQLRQIPDLRVASAGLGAPGRAVEPVITRLLADRRVDVSRKQSRRLDTAIVSPADLILTTTAAVASRVIADHEGVVSRCFPLLRFCDVVSERSDAETAAAWLRRQCGVVVRLGPATGDSDLVAPDVGDRLAVFELVDRVMLGLLRFVDAGWPDSVG